MPFTSRAARPASRMARRTASTAIARVVRPEPREYSVSPTPTMQYLSRSVFIGPPCPAGPPPAGPPVPARGGGRPREREQRDRDEVQLAARAMGEVACVVGVVDRNGVPRPPARHGAG